MKLSAYTIKELLQTEPPLITGLSPEQTSGRMEGSKVDLTLAAVATLEQVSNLSAFMGVNFRKTPPTKEIEPSPLPYSSTMKTGDGWVLFPGFYLLQTNETLNMPFWLIGNIQERTSIFRNGSICRVTSADPGFSGKITCALFVPPRTQLVIEQNARFLSIRFEPIINVQFHDGLPIIFGISRDPSETDPYKGIWSGDKRSTEGAVERGF